MTYLYRVYDENDEYNIEGWDNERKGTDGIKVVDRNC
jgi:hypothetical protein